MIRTGRVGEVCAVAIRDVVGSAAAPATRCRKLRRGSFIAVAREYACARWQLAESLHYFLKREEG